MRRGRLFTGVTSALAPAALAASFALSGCTDRMPAATSVLAVRPAPVAHPERMLDVWHAAASGPAVRSFVAQPRVTGPLIYGCDITRNGCFWFVQGHDRIAGSIGGLDQPQGIGVSPTTGDLYVANSGASDVRVYAPNRTLVVADLPDPGQVPVDVAVGGGLVYVANAFTTSGGPGSVTVMDAGTGQIVSTLTDPNVSQGVSVSLDEDHFVSFCFIRKDDAGECDAFPHGRGHGQPIASGWGFTGGSSFDNAEHLVVSDDSNGQLLTFDGSTLCGTATFQGGGVPVWIALDQTNRLMYTGDIINAIIEAYPFADCASGTLRPVKTYQNDIGGSDIMSVAVTPGARP